MTSDCFVYITLPGATEAVPAARLKVSTDKDGHQIGELFYGRRYLERPDRVAIDPVQLKLAETTFKTASLGGMFGALRDASPDLWGRRIIERHTGKPTLSELDYLLQSPDDRAGALGFGLHPSPPAPLRRFNQTVQLAALQAVADAIVADEPLPVDAIEAQAKHLLLLGTSMGGARPKAVVEDGGCLWLAKFNRLDDKTNSARIEHAMLVLARACGLNVADSRVVSVGDRDVLLVKRFDRERVGDDAYRRARMISALTLLQADERRDERWSYTFFAEELRRISVDPKNDARELFRRMCFNALTTNVDDHPRNHALVAFGREWRLSPAYDLTPLPQTSIERRDLALTVGRAGRWANAENALSECRRFLLERDEASAVIDKMEKTVRKTWFSTARAAGVSEQDCERIRGAFAYQGFRLPLPIE
jgi:serine/threonine-protein kinase HipA